MSNSAGFHPIPLAVAETYSRVIGADHAIFLPGENNAFVLYRDRADQVEEGRYSILAESGVSHVFVRGGEASSFESSLEANLSEILSNPSIGPTEKASCVHQVGAGLARDLLQRFGGRPTVERAARVVDQVIESVLRDQSVAEQLLRICGHHQSTASHSFAVSTLSIMLGARALGQSPSPLRELGLAGMLHDVGKISISPLILNKSGPLTPAELKVIRQHPVESIRLLGDDVHVSPEVRRMVLEHHERYDGGGYPLGLPCSELAVGSRILTIADSYHALVGRRAYREGHHPLKANEILRSSVGTQLDPELFALWEEMFLDSWGEHRWTTADPPQAEKVRAYHADHASLPAMQHERRWVRVASQGDVRIRCVHVGRLPADPRPTTAAEMPLMDVSRAGLCLGTDTPLYRGEVLHIAIPDGSRRRWMRGMVMWCRRTAGPTRFRSGVEYAGRLRDEQVGQPEAVQGM